MHFVELDYSKGQYLEESLRFNFINEQFMLNIKSLQN